MTALLPSSTNAQYHGSMFSVHQRSKARVRLVRSPGSSSRSETRITEARFRCCVWMSRRAMPSPAEIRVPALNDCVQGLVGNAGANPGVVWRGRVK